MPEVLLPGSVLALSGQAADRLLRLDSGKAQERLGWRALYTLEETLAQAAAFQLGLAHTPAVQLCRAQVGQYLDRVRETTE